MKRFYFFYTLFFFSLLMSFSAQAQTANITEGCLPLSVQFTGPSGLPSYYWDFDNDGFSELQNPSRTFNEAGTYEVTLAETNGGAVIGTISITVYAEPQLAIEATPSSGCAPMISQFEQVGTIDPAIDFTSQWSFGALGTSTEASPTFTFPEGTFNIALSIESNLPNCSVTEQFTNFIQVTNSPSVSFNANPGGACEGPLDVNFELTSDPNLDYAWDFGNGNTFMGNNPPTQTFEEGTYTITLTGTNELDCSSTSSTIISVGPPVVAFSFPDTICVGKSFEFENESPNGNYMWDFGDGTTSTEANPEHTYEAGGTYQVSLMVETAVGCENTATQTVEVGAADATFTPDPSYTCDGEVEVDFVPNTSGLESYQWSFYDGTSSTDELVKDTIYGYDTMTYSVNMPMIFSTTLTVTGTGGCTDTHSEFVTIDRPNAEFMPDTISGCAPLEVVFADSSISNVPIAEWLYDFDNGDTDSNTTGDDITYTFTEPGEYDVVLITTTELGCKDTSYAIQILVGEAIGDIDFTADQTTVCVGDTVNFSGTSASMDIDAWHFETDGGRSFHCYQDPNMAWTFDTEVGSMDVTLITEYNGCLSSVTKEDFITVNGPLAKLAYDIDCAAPYTVMFRDSSMDATSVTWDFGDGMTSTELNPTHIYADTGDYKVILTAVNPSTGCPESKDSTIVCIRDIKASFELDTLLCQGQLYILDASPSEGVDQRCWRGITWDIPRQSRPITTNQDQIEFIFGEPGPDVVNLYVTDINGCKDTMSLDVEVFSVSPTITHDATPPVCYPTQPITFTSESTADTTIVSWEWLFGDGTEDEGEEVSHIFNTPAASATLTVTDTLGCIGTTTTQIADYYPFTTITASETAICVGDSINFSAMDFTEQGSSLSFAWNFSNGETSTNQEETVTFTEPGVYPIVLEIQEIDSGCPGVPATTTIIVEGYPEASFTNDLETDPFCAPEIVNFVSTTTTTSPTTYIWNLDDGQVATGETASYNYGAGTYTVTLTATTNLAGCADNSEPFTFTALSEPSGSFTINTNGICNGEEIIFSLVDTSNVASYTWDFGDGTTVSDVDNVAHTYNLPQGEDEITVILTMISIDGDCPGQAEQTFAVAELSTDFDVAVDCNGNAIFVNNSTDADVYEWDFGDGTLVNGAGNVSHTYDAVGTYTVTLTATDALSNCQSTATQEVVVTNIEEPVANFTVTEDCGTVNVQNLSTGATNYTWTFEGGETSTDENPSSSYSEVGDYTIQLIASNADGTCTATATQTVTVSEVPDTDLTKLSVPNVITPNGDGLNDFFTIYDVAEPDKELSYEVIRFEVFNRWGQKVYDNDTPATGWDGRYNDKYAPQDVYIYNIEIRAGGCGDLESKTFVGDVTILR